MNIDELATKFVSLAGKPTFSKSELSEARKLMQQLKKQGMSNEEISELSKGRWSESTVKGYAKGVKVAGHNPWHDSVTLLGELISMDISLEDVGTSVAVFNELKSRGIHLDQAVDLLASADSASVDVADLIQQHEGLKECGLSPKDVLEALALRKELEEKGLGLDSLTLLVKLAQNFGDPEKVIEAVSGYGSLSEIHDKIAVAKEELEGSHEKLVCGGQQLEELEASLSQLKNPLEAYEKAVKLGFAEEELARLSGLATKYGGVKEVLQAVEAYTDYADITAKIGKAKAAGGDIKAKIDKLETEYGHLKTATTMCNSLVHQYNFGLDAIATIFSVAKKYGEPVDVLKGVESYGKLQSLEQELGELEGKVTEREEQFARLEGKHNEMVTQLESLNAVALKVGEEVGRVQSELARSKGLERVLSLINDPASADYNEYGPLVLAVAASIRKWVTINENRFKFPHNIKSGLDDLIAGLGGA